MELRGNRRELLKTIAGGAAAAAPAIVMSSRRSHREVMAPSVLDCPPFRTRQMLAGPAGKVRLVGGEIRRSR